MSDSVGEVALCRESLKGAWLVFYLDWSGGVAVFSTELEARRAAMAFEHGDQCVFVPFCEGVNRDGVVVKLCVSETRRTP